MKTIALRQKNPKRPTETNNLNFVHFLELPVLQGLSNAAPARHRGSAPDAPRVYHRNQRQDDMRAKTAVVLGAQWGDEGKGKIVDVLSERFAAVARYAGGHNAGHTVIIGGQKFVLQLIPCGVLRPGCRGIIGNGVVLDPIAFLKEVEKLRALGVTVDEQLFVSNRAQVILPYHRMIELAAESAPGRKKIGTTSRGIGPAYEDKMARSGLRVVDLLRPELLKTHIEAACAEKNAIVKALFGAGTAPLDPEKMFDEYAAAAEQVRPFVADTGRLLNRILAEGGSVMFEGAQGTMLDIDHGTYPFVTSSSATAGGAATGTGVGPTAIGTVISVTKAYVTRVGGGPFPTEIHDAAGEELRARGNEYGAVTGRPRRCGWLDIPLLRYSNHVNGAEWLVITKLDVLDTLAEIPVCIGYEIGGSVTDEIPADVDGLEHIKPVYTTLKGWQSSTEGITEFEKLPQAAKDYLRFQEQESGARIGMVSTGPDRDQTMVLPEFASALDSIHR
jgi:adenylosuccinate synthase